MPERVSGLVKRLLPRSRYERALAEREAQLSAAQEALRLGEERMRLAMTGAQLGSWHWNVRTGELIWSDLSCAMFGLPPGTQLTFESFLARIHPEDRARVVATIQHALAEHSDYDIELRCVWDDGTVRWLSTRGRAFYDTDGEPLRMEGVAFDITAKKEAAEQIAESAARFERLAEVMPHLVWQLTPEGKLLYANQRARHYLGVMPEGDRWVDFIHPDDRLRSMAVLGLLAEKDGRDYVNEVRLRRSDGTYRWFVSRAVAVHDAAGKLLHIVGTSTDIDDLKAAEAALRDSQQRLELAIKAANIGLWDWHARDNRAYFSPDWKRQIGYEDHELPNRQEEWTSRVHPDDWPRVQAQMQAHQANATRPYTLEFRLRHKDGSYRNILSYGMSLFDRHGHVERMIGCHVDLTENKRLEEELRQAQKMEAVGRLAGGVAHDFNNLLTVILGHVSLIQAHRDLPRDVPEAVRAIAMAAERAASLTAQLLAFGRRQVMQSLVLDLGALVADVIKMLRRVLGEDVVLQYEPAREPTPVQGDASMLTQVLLNLAVNARDAMPQGGQLTIRTSVGPLDANVGDSAAERALPWVCLSVTDTGTGITPELLPRIFEPFVTSKEVGKGTGLGLSTVYGIVRQHQGYVTVHSEVDRGSTFKVFLPLAQELRPATAPEPRPERPRGHGELILLVEDDQLVRTVLNEILLQHGYRVALARTGNEALHTWSEHGDEVDLVFTDAVMPGGLTGLEVLDSLRAKKPSLKAILSSGYSAELFGESRTDPCVSFLQKPFSTEQLLRRIRHVLDQA